MTTAWGISIKQNDRVPRHEWIMIGMFETEQEALVIAESIENVTCEVNRIEITTEETYYAP